VALGRPLGAKLFLDGKEVPFLGATITCTVNQASIAYVDLVPHKAINDIKPRTHVSIAVRDFNNPGSASGPSSTTTTGTKKKAGPRVVYPYVSAWEGEVFGFNFGKSTSSRSFSISCIDSTSYWDNALSYFLDAQQSLGSGAFDLIREGQNINTASQQGFPVIPADAGENVSYFDSIVTKTLDADPDNTFLDALVAVLKNVTNINSFYKIADQKLRIQDRLIFESTSAKFLNKLINAKQAQAWFSGVSHNGGWKSVRSVVQDLLSLIFHDFVPAPFPSRVEIGSLAGGPKLPGSIDDKTTTIGNYLFKPNLYMVPPPVCNVFFPDEYSQFTYSRNFFQEPTRLIYQPEMPQFGSAESVPLPMRFQPESFEAYMLQRPIDKFIGGPANPLFVDKDPGSYLDPIKNNPTTTKNRIGQFLTNEERVKGIWLTNESMMPATTIFSSALNVNQNSQLKLDFTGQVCKYLFYKKRFENRQIQITSHLKLSVVPGFNVLILDDSVAGHNVLAYCSSVTHRIYATEGGYTNVTLSYARTPEEEAASSTTGNEPPVPAWLDPTVFGTFGTASSSVDKEADDAVKSAGQVLLSNSNLSKFYKSLLGAKGYKAITDYPPPKGTDPTTGVPYSQEPTIIGSVAYLLDKYSKAKKSGADIQQFIASITSRDYVRIRDAMRFLGCGYPNQDLHPNAPPFNFIDGAFSTTNPDYGDINALRQKPITDYIAALQTYRGFRG
jgi:hypothetical protein